MPLWLNSPVGYPYCEKIEKGDFERLRHFLIQLTAGNKELDEIARTASHAQIIKILEDSHFTFDAEWYGPRDINNQYGAAMSALDDPNYRMKRGIGSGL